MRAVAKSVRVVSIGALGVLFACSGMASSSVEGDQKVATTRDALQAANLIGTSLPAKTLALTFDDGPGARTTELSAYLKSENIRAAFFVNGAHIAATNLPNPNGIALVQDADDVLAQLIADGHLVANHTETHRDLVTEVLPSGAGQLLEELAQTDAQIAGYVPSNHFLFRPPYGSWNATVYAALKDTAMSKYIGPVYWDFGGTTGNYPYQAADWACWQGQLQEAAGGPVNGTGYATTEQCGDAYLNDITSVGRGIVLMHDPYGWANGSTVDMVKYIVPKLKQAGYGFVRVDEVPAIAAALPCAPGCATCAPTDPNACTSCADDAYLKGSQCVACKTCAAGTFVSAVCTATADATCATCAPGTASSSPDQASCATCAAGTYAGAGASACKACAAGTYAAAGSSACTTCAVGTFAAAGSSACTACAAGTYADQPGSSACTECVGGCDDGDVCTTDTCDSAKGCLHATIDGCGVVTDAGTDAGEVDGGDVEPEDGGDAVGEDAGTEDAGSTDGPSDASVFADASTHSGDASSEVPAAQAEGGCSTGGGNAGSGGVAFMVGALASLRARRRLRRRATG